jgi:uncharacterized OB-fold protein
MSEYAKFLPEGIPSWQMPYWDSLREHAVRVQRCDNCGVFRYVPKELCHNCHTTAASWTPIAGTGELYTFTVVRRAPTPAYQADAPYAIGHVAMAEGFRMIGMLRNVDLEQTRIGMPLQVVYDDVTPEWSLLRFEPA